MRINTKHFGLSVAIVAALLWSFYSFGNLCLDIVIITYVNGNLSNFNWGDYANRYLAQIIVITLITGILGWLTTKIYNDLEDIFSLKLK